MLQGLSSIRDHGVTKAASPTGKPVVRVPHQAHQVPGGHDLEGALELLPKVSRDKCALKFFRKTVGGTHIRARGSRSS